MNKEPHDQTPSRTVSPAAGAGERRPKNLFFITGLPRSRTAWLANYLTHGDTFCLHDGLRGCDSFRDFEHRLASLPARNAGSADPALLMLIDKVAPRFSTARWVFIRRDPDECAREFSPLVPDLRVVTGLAARMEEWAGRLGALEIPFAQIDERLPEIAAFCAPGFASPPERDAMLRTWDVQIPLARLAQAPEHDRAGFEKLLASLITTSSLP